MRSFVIHMSSSADRRANAERLASDLPGGELVEAVDGRDAGRVRDVEVFGGNLHRPRYPFALRPAEIGVFESHRKVWRLIVDQEIDYAIVTEDDLQIDPDRFAGALKLVEEFASPASYIRLPVKQGEVAVETLAHEDGIKLILPRKIGLQCICQVVGREAARRLLSVTDQIDRPVDTLLQMHWITGQPVHAILGTGNREVAAQIGGSTIQKKIRPSQKLGREFRRAIYKVQLAMHPQRP